MNVAFDFYIAPLGLALYVFSSFYYDFAPLGLGLCV
jgi:hypothetical protein